MRHEVPAVGELRVGVEVAEVVHRHGFDPGRLQLLGHFEARARHACQGLDVVAPTIVVQTRELVVGPARDRDPAVVDVAFVGARETRRAASRAGWLLPSRRRNTPSTS